MFNVGGSHKGRPAVFQGFSDFSHENTQLYNVCRAPAQMFSSTVVNRYLISTKQLPEEVISECESTVFMNIV